MTAIRSAFVEALESACGLTHWVVHHRPWLWLPLPICPLGSLSAWLDERWDTGVWTLEVQPLAEPNERRKEPPMTLSNASDVEAVLHEIIDLAERCRRVWAPRADDASQVPPRVSVEQRVYEMGAGYPALASGADSSGGQRVWRLGPGDDQDIPEGTEVAIPVTSVEALALKPDPITDGHRRAEQRARSAFRRVEAVGSTVDGWGSSPNDPARLSTVAVLASLVTDTRWVLFRRAQVGRVMGGVLECALADLRAVDGWRATMLRSERGERDPEGVDNDTWCSSCLRIKHCEPRAKDRTLCGWCDSFKRTNGQLPPSDLLRRHHEGRRISETDVARSLHKRTG